MAATASYSTSTPTVMLTFRGKDIQDSLTDHIYIALLEAGMITFRNDDGIRNVQELKPGVERLITASRATIVVLSKSFANSSSCLDELLLILKQRREGSHWVIPVFYGVEPSDVRNQQGSFTIKAKEASKWTADQVNRWKIALREVANLSGWVVTGNETNFILELVPRIVETIYFRLGKNFHGNMEGRSIGKLFVSSKEIAKGSNGTVVFEGIYEGQGIYNGCKVAVKRLVKAHLGVDSRDIQETQHLMDADRHPNIVRWYTTEFDSDFVYIALERCDCTLYDLIQTKMYSESFELMKPNGHPSCILLNLMRDTCAGLVHLHKLSIIHRDLKPHNVLIVRGEIPCVKLADMGISRPLVGGASSLGLNATVSGTSGWRAKEQILDGGHQTLAMDMFSLGCVFFFCMTGGMHPFGDRDCDRDRNVIDNKVNLSMVKHIPEAEDLCSQLLNPDPKLRPTASEVLLHPLFWNSETRMSFMREMSDWVESESQKGSYIALTNEGCVVFPRTWNVIMDPAFVSHMKMKRRKKYNYNMVQDLLRIIRNTMNHYQDLPLNIQNMLGSMPEGLDDYFRIKFPKLLMKVYNFMNQHYEKEEWFLKYLKN